ncbi:MAG: hypothetical protein AB8B61_08160 [Cyclobacteriaceae bacterium]
MKYSTYLLTLLTIFIFLVAPAAEPKNTIEDYLYQKVKNPDLLATSNNYLVSAFEREHEMVHNVEIEIKRREGYYVSAKTPYFFIEYNLYKKENGDAVIGIHEIVAGNNTFRFVKYSKTDNSFVPASFSVVCSNADAFLNHSQNASPELVYNKYRLHKDGLMHPGEKYPSIKWDGEEFYGSEELVSAHASAIRQKTAVSKKRKKKR